MQSPSHPPDPWTNEPPDQQADEQPEDGPVGLRSRLAEAVRESFREGFDTPNGRLRIALAFLAVITLALLIGLLAGTRWGRAPEPPLEALGLGTEEPGHGGGTDTGRASDGLDSDEASDGSVELDPEQQAFAERRQQELADQQSQPDTGGSVPDFTDHALVQELAGAWRLDLGRGRRGYRVRFGSDAVRKVHRERFDVTLYDVVGRGAAGRGLPPYFTVLDLPDGKLLAFLDAAGSFRLVLEDVRREPDGRLSWRGPQRERRYGTRLDGDSSWRFGRDRQPDEAERPEPAPGVAPRPDPPQENPGDGPPSVGVRPPPGPVSEAAASRLHDEVERHLDELAFGLMEHDAERIFALWGGAPDPLTRSTVESLLERYEALRAWTRVLQLDVTQTEDGPQARFEVVVTLQGAPRGARNRRDVDLRDVRWRGRVALRGDAGVQLDPFSG